MGVFAYIFGNTAVLNADARNTDGTYVFITDTEHEVAPLEVDFGDPRPVVVADLVLVPEDDDAARREPEEVLYIVFPLKKNKIKRLRTSLVDVFRHVFSVFAALQEIRLTSTGCRSTPYMSSHLTRSRYANSASAGSCPLQKKKKAFSSI